MVARKTFFVKSLEILALEAVVARLQACEIRAMQCSNDQLVRKLNDFWRYSVFMRPVVARVTTQFYFESFETLFVFFVSVWSREKKVNLFERFRTRAVDLIVDHHLLDHQTLQSVSELCVGVDFSYKRDRLFSMIPHLQKFRIVQGLTDETVESVVRHFPDLRVLDCSLDDQCSVTDNGLKALASIKKLKFLLFPTELSPLDRATFTASGLASLMTQLPELVRLTCAITLLGDALDILQLSDSKLLTIKSLNLEECDFCSEILVPARTVCPNVERLKLFVFSSQVDFFNRFFRQCWSLKKLHLYLCEFQGFPFKFGAVGKQLLVLYLEYIFLDLDDMITMSEECPNLKFLTFGGSCAHNSPTLEDCLHPSWPLLFPHLETLDFRWGDPCTLCYFTHKRSSLVRLVIACEPDDAFVLRSLRFSHGFWPKVETVTLKLRRKCSDVYDEELARHLVEVLPALTRLFASILGAEGMTMTSSRGNVVVLCSHDSTNLYSRDPELEKWEY